MPRKNNRIQELISILFTRYINHKSSKDEQELVEKIYDSIGTQEEIEQESLDQIKQQIKASIDKKINQQKLVKLNPKRYYFSAAAILLFSLGIGLYIYKYADLSRTQTVQNSVAHLNKSSSSPILSLDNEETYELAKNIPEGTSYEIIDDEKVLDLTLLEKNNHSKKITIVNPSKDPISVLLSDGSQVWLNYKSTLEFEYDQSQNIRIAKAQGEVFFDVQKLEKNGQKIPFKVYTALQTIEVLGTKFNVNTTMHNEESVELLEGSIRLIHNYSDEEILLEPGQKAFLDIKKPQILVINSKNDEKAKAWRKGLFYFEDETMSMIAKELSNWYEIPMVVAPELNNLSVTAMIKRYDSIDQVLELLELTNNIKTIKMKGKVYVNTK